MTAMPEGARACEGLGLYEETIAALEPPDENCSLEVLPPDDGLPEGDSEAAKCGQSQEYIPSVLSTADAKRVVQEWLREELSPSSRSLPIAVRLKAALAIDIAQDTGKLGVSLGRLIRNVFGDARLPSYKYRQFIDAVTQDGRLYCQRRGHYVFHDPSILPAQKVNREVIRVCVEAVAQKTEPGQTIRANNLLGFAKHAGHMLTSSEVGAFIAAVASDPRITPEENGDFRNNGTVVQSDPFSTALDLSQERIYSRDDLRHAARFYPLTKDGVLFRPNKGAYNTLTRGARHINPGKFQDAQAWRLCRNRFGQRPRR